MRLVSSINTVKISELRSSINALNQIINAIGEFKDHYDKKFNFSKLAKFLEIPKSEIDSIISLILNFQEKFGDVFKGYYLKKKIIDDQIYLVTEKKQHTKKDREITKVQKKTINNLEGSIVKKVKINKTQAKLLSDLIYLFKFVKRGQGFDLKNNGSELIKNLKKLIRAHPYLFKTNGGNNLIYPTEIGLELGSLITSYNKSRKKIENLKIKNYNFNID